MKCSACSKYKSRGARFPYPLKIPLLSPEDKEYFCPTGPTGTTLSGFRIWEYFERLCSVINRSWEWGIEVQELSELCKPFGFSWRVRPQAQLCTIYGIFCAG